MFVIALDENEKISFFTSLDLISVLNKVKEYIISLNFSNSQDLFEIMETKKFKHEINSISVQKVEVGQIVYLYEKTPKIEFVKVNEERKINTIIKLKKYINKIFSKFEFENYKYFEDSYTSDFSEFDEMNCYFYDDTKTEYLFSDEIWLNSCVENPIQVPENENLSNEIVKVFMEY